ncbi:MAG: HEAT repeat domain-containing protein [Chlamydiales bacterium]|nr:HEAT repeat domain-containing protein [Chlamydiales bacterium]
MNRIKFFLLLSTLFSPLLLTAEVQPAAEPISEESSVDKRQITYLLQSGEYSKSFALYRKWKTKLGRHDFEVLHQFGQILLEEGARSSDPERQLVSIFGAGLAGTSSSWEILESGIRSPHPQTQMATIQLLGRLQDDHSDELLVKAMGSEFFFSRLEAAYFLSMRKHRMVTGQLEALMHRVPEEMRFFFPEFFALIGTTDAISVLRHMMDERSPVVRTEAILNAGRYERDDLLPQIRAQATHLNIAEQEACAYALGILKDSKSLPQLKKLSASPSANVRLSALKSLYLLGNTEVKEELVDLAKGKDLFAIASLGELQPGDTAHVKELLFALSQDSNLQVRFNATVSLLMTRDERAARPLIEFLLRDGRDLGFQPQFSLGRANMAWKVVTSASHKSSEQFDLSAISLSVREHLLRLSLELPETAFLRIARSIFDSRQSDLVPLLVHLLENLHTEESITLLKEKSQTAGAPLIRAYCNLALFRLRLDGNYEKQLMEWLGAKKESELFRFRPMTMRSSLRLADCSFELTPEEHSKLLIESLEALVRRYEEKGLDLLLTLLQEGNPKNRPILAGLLLQMMQ